MECIHDPSPISVADSHCQHLESAQGFVLRVDYIQPIAVCVQRHGQQHVVNNNNMF